MPNDQQERLRRGRRWGNKHASNRKFLADFHRRVKAPAAVLDEGDIALLKTYGMGPYTVLSFSLQQWWHGFSSNWTTIFRLPSNNVKKTSETTRTS
jgi:hypothetical protein